MLGVLKHIIIALETLMRSQDELLEAHETHRMPDGFAHSSDDWHQQITGRIEHLVSLQLSPLRLCVGLRRCVEVRSARGCCFISALGMWGHACHSEVRTLRTRAWTLSIRRSMQCFVC